MSMFSKALRKLTGGRGGGSASPVANALGVAPSLPSGGLFGAGNASGIVEMLKQYGGMKGPGGQPVMPLGQGLPAQMMPQQAPQKFGPASYLPFGTGGGGGVAQPMMGPAAPITVAEQASPALEASMSALPAAITSVIGELAEGMDEDDDALDKVDQFADDIGVGLEEATSIMEQAQMPTGPGAEMAQQFAYGGTVPQQYAGGGSVLSPDMLAGLGSMFGRYLR